MQSSTHMLDGQVMCQLFYNNVRWCTYLLNYPFCNIVGE